MSGRLEGRAALVVGASRGIGQAIAERFAAEGASVAIANRRYESARRSADALRETGANAWCGEVDATSYPDLAATVDDVAAHFGRLDVVVHNAATSTTDLIEELSEEALDLTLAVNLKACFHLAKSAVPHLRKSDAGRILVTSSVTGPRVVMSRNAHYAASKAGVNGFIRAAAMEFAQEGITVNGVEPGFICTPALQEYSGEDELKSMASYIPMKRLGEPDDVANAMAFLASSDAKYITGQTIIVDGGSTLPESPVHM